MGLKLMADFLIPSVSIFRYVTRYITLVFLEECLNSFIKTLMNFFENLRSIILAVLFKCIQRTNDVGKIPTFHPPI